MPRIEFNTLYTEVSSTLLGIGTQYNLVKVLACYKNDGELDTDFCGGTVAAPEPNSHKDGLGWCLRNVDTNEHDYLTVQNWIASIASGPSPDKLTNLDALIDGQLGSLGTALENIIDSTRVVPLSIDYFKKHKIPPLPKIIRRQTDMYGCPTTSAATPTPSRSLQKEDIDHDIVAQRCTCGSTTLPLLTVSSATNPAQSCACTAIPTTTGINPNIIMTTTYTSAYQACTLVGGITDPPTCRYSYHWLRNFNADTGADGDVSPGFLWI